MNKFLPTLDKFSKRSLIHCSFSSTMISFENIAEIKIDLFSMTLTIKRHISIRFLCFFHILTNQP